MTAITHMPYNTNRSSKTANEVFGRNVIKLRSLRNITQAEIGRSSPVSQRTVSNLEKLGEAGTSNLDTVEALAEYFKIPMWQLFLDNMPTDPAVQKRLDEAVQAMLDMTPAGLQKVFDRIDELKYLDSKAL